MGYRTFLAGYYKIRGKLNIPCTVQTKLKLQKKKRRNLLRRMFEIIWFNCAVIQIDSLGTSVFSCRACIDESTYHTLLDFYAGNKFTLPKVFYCSLWKSAVYLVSISFYSL